MSGAFESPTLRSDLARQSVGQALDRTVVTAGHDRDSQPRRSAIHLVELGLRSSVVPSWHAHLSAARAPVVAIPISGLAPIRIGWAMRESYELHEPAREFMRLLKRDIQARPTQSGVRLLPASGARARRP